MYSEALETHSCASRVRFCEKRQQQPASFSRTSVLRKPLQTSQRMQRVLQRKVVCQFGKQALNPLGRFQQTEQCARGSASVTDASEPASSSGKTPFRPASAHISTSTSTSFCWQVEGFALLPKSLSLHSQAEVEKRLRSYGWPFQAELLPFLAPHTPDRNRHSGSWPPLSA